MLQALDLAKFKDFEETTNNLKQKLNKQYKHALKQGYNFPIQSLGASITKRAMVQLFRSGFDVVTQVHDSIVCQAKAGEADHKARFMQLIMQQVYPVSVPLGKASLLL